MINEAYIKVRTVPLIFGYGGGVNTMAALIVCLQRGVRPDLISFADTGDEKPETYAYIEEVTRPWLARVGFPGLTVVRKASPRTGDKSLEEECLRRETMPSRAFGLSSCAMRWKIEPQEKFLNHWPPARATWARCVCGHGMDAHDDGACPACQEEPWGPRCLGAKKQRPIKIIGYDGGEGRRAEITEDAKLIYWYPLIEWDIDRDSCVAVIEGAGLPVPPKSACYYCPSSTKTEVLALSRSHPDHFKRALHMEAVALTSKRHDLVSIKGLGRHWSWAELVRADEEARRQMPEAPVESCMICDDGGCDAT